MSNRDEHPPKRFVGYRDDRQCSGSSEACSAVQICSRPPAMAGQKLGRPRATVPLAPKKQINGRARGDSSSIVLHLLPLLSEIVKLVNFPLFYSRPSLTISQLQKSTIG